MSVCCEYCREKCSAKLPKKSRLLRGKVAANDILRYRDFAAQ
jgi:hypothetical protein